MKTEQVFIALSGYRVIDASMIVDAYTYEGMLYVRYAVTGTVMDVAPDQQRPLLHYLASKSLNLATKIVINDMMVELGWEELDEYQPTISEIPDAAVE